MTFESFSIEMVPLAVVAVVGVIAAIIDIRIFKVHNFLTVPLAVSGLLFHLYQAGASGIAHSLGGLLIGFLSLIIFYALGGIGAGDVKLMSGVGAWLGAWLTLNVLIVAGIASGVYSVFLIAKTGGFRHILANLSILVYRMRAMAMHFGNDERVEEVVADVHGNRRQRLVPFAAMVFMGIVAVICGANALLIP